MMDSNPECTPLTQPEPIHFLPVPGFSMIGLMAAMEPLQVANRYHNNLFSWRFLSEDGNPVKASNGLEFEVDQSLKLTGPLSTLIICAGFHPEQICTPKFFTWLRARAAEGTVLGGVDTGSIVLARAGLLKGYRATVHWQHLASFQEHFIDVILTGNLFEIDRDRFTSSGGTSSLDMMLRLISLKYGHALAVQVSEALVHERIREAHEDQRMQISLRHQAHHPKLNSLIKLMEEHLESPLTIAQLSEKLDMSSRQVQRIFQDLLGESPGRFYLRLRLEKGGRLLRQTSMRIMDVALASGFSSNASFTKSYKALFGYTPHQERQREKQTVIPDNAR